MNTIIVVDLGLNCLYFPFLNGNGAYFSKFSIGAPGGTCPPVPPPPPCSEHRLTEMYSLSVFRPVMSRCDWLYRIYDCGSAGSMTLPHFEINHRKGNSIYISIQPCLIVMFIIHYCIYIAIIYHILITAPFILLEKVSPIISQQCPWRNLSSHVSVISMNGFNKVLAVCRATRGKQLGGRGWLRGKVDKMMK